ncbi:hypothetical protein PF005_g6914 [Phytophthora fragariae]|uniref:Secreted protein n=1 Tax=Phytophthora fragariae TaxID=53985 RepID=A0A6A3YQT9_9STRA|nr:hypothetical protein PF003_g20310 [Phytophthora fragariae]KAE8942698.1 hypothetical protein PF009_g7571 [Phytophthora fragariae]KAE9017316.1 hypothetical protein PF011_g6744 [Phytophthora fragariae]KAE9121420.1 hypothetical protein PF010_g7110 [Phytophthora fragariae]KAE9123060.1 hypothetical protein PF007_g7204 [Phytophthora fragariae]
MEVAATAAMWLSLGLYLFFDPAASCQHHARVPHVAGRNLRAALSGFLACRCRVVPPLDCRSSVTSRRTPTATDQQKKTMLRV